MNETIGVKGGHNDFRRVMTITKNQKKKLRQYQEEKEIKDLEKEVKKKQRYTLIRTLPIVLAGQAFVELTKPKKEKEEDKFIVIDEEKTKEKNKPETKKIVVVLKDGSKQVIEVPIHIDLEEDKKEIHVENKKLEEKKPTKEEKQEEIPILEEKETEYSEFKDLTESQRQKLQKLQARKIIDIYEKQLKDIRFELRNLIIEYNTLIDDEDKIIKSREEERILDKLNEIIKKIEELKNKIKIDNLDKYDDNYIYTLVEEYLAEFKDKKIIKDIKDSPLYILISDKLDEFDKKKEKFKSEVEERTEDLKDKEDKLAEMREKYFKLDRINNSLNEFYVDQERLLREMQDKIDNAVTETEKVEVKIQYMNRQTERLLRRLSLLMLIPGPRGAKAFAAMTTIYADMARQMMNPRTITKKYKVITVYDYSKDIEKNIEKIDRVKGNLSKTSNDLDKLLSNIKDEYKEFIGVNKDCDDLISNLEKVKDNLREKEYELDKIKTKQERELERNNAKVLTKGTYPM